MAQITSLKWVLSVILWFEVQASLVLCERVGMTSVAKRVLIFSLYIYLGSII